MPVVTYRLIDVDGVSHALDATTGVFVEMSPTGFGMPPISVAEDKLAFSPGTVLRRVATASNKLKVPLFIQAASAAALDVLMDSVRGWVLPGTENNDTPKTVILQVTRQDGVQREIEAVYDGGLEGDYAAGDEASQRAILSLRAPDPYWRSIADTTLTVDRGEGLATWFPWPPVQLNRSTVFAERTTAKGNPIINSGQVEAWPVWTVHGPGSSLTISNLTTGLGLTLETMIDASEIVTIDTRPRKKLVVDQNGVRRFADLSADSALWALAAGANDVRISMPNARAASFVTLAYRQRYAGVRR